MNFMGQTVGSCGCKQQTFQPTYEQCKQVVQTCNVEEVPHYINYHTHVVNNMVKKHVNIPTYSMSEENILIEYPPAQTIPYMPYNTNMGYGCGNSGMMYANQPMPGNQSQTMYPGQMAQYQGNVGTQPSMYPGMNMPYNY